MNYKRITLFLVFIAAFILFLGPGAVFAAEPGDIIVNEIMNNPSAVSDSAGEWFELDGFDPSSPFMLRIMSFREDKRDLVPAVVHVDGTGRVQSALEAKLGMAPGSPSLTFAAEVDHGKDTMRFGYGLNIGG